MNEGIDLAFIGAKVATRENIAASLAVHGLSAAYNIAQLYRYRVAYLDGQRLLTNGVTQAITNTEQYQREVIKHSLLAGFDIISFFLISFQDRR